MKIQLATAANRDERDDLFDRLRTRGFVVTNQERSKTGSIKMSKEYADPVTGEFRARVNITAINIGSAGKAFEYSLYIETNGEYLAEGNSMEMATQQQYRMSNFVLFIDAALSMPACKGVPLL